MDGLPPAVLRWKRHTLNIVVATDEELEDLEIFEQAREQDRLLAEEYLDLLDRQEHGEDVDEARLYYLELVDQRRNGAELTEDEVAYLKDIEENGLVDDNVKEEAQRDIDESDGVDKEETTNEAHGSEEQDTVQEASSKEESITSDIDNLNTSNIFPLLAKV